MPDKIVLYHNPRCSKSRNALALLLERRADVQVVEYLKQPPTRAALSALVEKLGVRPGDIARHTESIYREHYAGRDLTDAQWLDALVKDPILIERPIAVKGEQAVIGRPPEKVLELLD